MTPSSDIAFTPTVKALQSARGSREAYARMEAQGGFRTAIDERLVAMLAQANSAYLGTATAEGQPYIQHRGGPRGFIRVLGERTLGFADYTGNRQYVSTGNLADNPKAFLFLMDYARKARIKVWGTARFTDDPAVIAELMPEGYNARPEAALLFDIEAWDINCPQHIPQKFDADQVAAALEEREAEITRLKAEIARLKGTAA
ncbi:pyridoxamine 5'-phosphate oxidase family protein [Erythrobacter sp. CCH5-A1]|jgi:predicted pyridoxine 5'-phosphate oxidase superfamily flavin-nucleotide-binding protein|uniref:pyridoxamine 5'-phosphate oxidase family protein n=1 Tax=Erythrobacter sp. CCH5-A1 TaxID=1768792 RepID=UPI0008298A95|nr:pyridoxamine 5'-phosphate oxidase family protein [Erythrobacter sp. CCH5-A1]